MHDTNFVSRTCVKATGACADEPTDTPGGRVYAQLQTIKKQLSAVADGARLSAIRQRSMMTPPAAPQFAPTPHAAGTAPRAATPATVPAGSARPGTASTLATSRTPLSTLGNAAVQSDAEYWHRKYAPAPAALCTLHLATGGYNMSMLQSAAIQ